LHKCLEIKVVNKLVDCIWRLLCLI
jgi:hypothetical protein